MTRKQIVNAAQEDEVHQNREHVVNTNKLTHSILAVLVIS